MQNLPDEALDGFIESFIRGGTSTEALARAQAEKERRRRLQALPGVIAAAAVAGGEDPSALRTPAHRPARNGRRRAAGSASTAAAAAEGDDGSDEVVAEHGSRSRAAGCPGLVPPAIWWPNGPRRGDSGRRPSPRRPASATGTGCTDYPAVPSSYDNSFRRTRLMPLTAYRKRALACRPPSSPLCIASEWQLDHAAASEDPCSTL